MPMIQIKTKEDFISFLKENNGNINVENVIFAPDFDLEILRFDAEKEYKKMGFSDKFYLVEPIRQVVRNTFEKLNSKQRAQYVNRVTDWIYTQYSKSKTSSKNEDFKDLNKISLYPNKAFSIFFRGMIKRDFDKDITPDNQIFINYVNALFRCFYNFSNARILRTDFAQMVIEQGDKEVEKKFNIDYPNGYKVNPDKLYPRAANPNALHQINSNGNVDLINNLSSYDKGLINPTIAFRKLDASELYDLLTMVDKNKKNVWNKNQVLAIMSMIVDKSPANNSEYFDEIIQILKTNNDLFMVKNEDNYKLWAKIFAKFDKVIEKAVGNQKRLLDEIARFQKLDSEYKKDINAYYAKIEYKEDEVNTYNYLKSKIEYLKNTVKKDRYYKSFYEFYLARLESFLDYSFDRKQVMPRWMVNGAELVKPEHPWKVFGTKSEKYNYEFLIAMIEAVYDFNSRIRRLRIEKLGLKDRDKTLEELKMEQDSLMSGFKYNSILLDTDRETVKNKPYVELINGGKEVIKHKMKKIDSARKKLEERGYEFGRKSGVVIADEIAKKR